MVEDLNNLVKKLSAKRYNDSERIYKLEKLTKLVEKKINNQMKYKNEEDRKKTERLKHLVSSLDTVVSSLTSTQIDGTSINSLKRNL